MTELSLHADATESDPSRPAQRNRRDDEERASNLRQSLSASAAASEGFDRLEALFTASSLSDLERQVVYLAAAHANACHYCSREYPVSDDPRASEVAEAIGGDRAIPDPRLQALRRFTKAVTEQRGWVAEDVARRLTDAGFTHAQMLDAVLGVTLVNLGSYVSHLDAIPVERSVRLAS